MTQILGLSILLSLWMNPKTDLAKLCKFDSNTSNFTGDSEVGCTAFVHGRHR